MKTRALYSFLLATVSCYDPDQPVPNESPDESSDGEAGSSGAAEAGESSATTASETSGADTGVSTTVATSEATDEGTQDESTTVAQTCSSDDECEGDELCIEGECGPCSGASDPDDACVEASATRPYCDAELGCVACRPDQCDGDAPYCEPKVGCVACTEHAQCPDSACHLAGPDEGRCFDVADVVEISDVTELEAELAMVGPGAQRVFRVSGQVPDLGSYTVGGELAIIGEAGAELSGGFTNLFNVGEGAFLYLGTLALSDGAFRAISGPGSVWLDDVRISGYTIGLNAVGDAHVRRSRIDASGGDSVAVHVSGTLAIENSAVGPDAALAFEVAEGGQLDAWYTTVISTTTAASCVSGGAGTVRNSILVGDAASVSSCFAMTWVDNAVADDGFGTVVAPYDAGWFVDVAEQDFHLTASGDAVFAGLADWDDGDPLVDIDGDPRPQEAAGTPGLDEP